MPDYRLGFTTLDHEIQCDHLPVRGALPAWLRGSLVRNGPARFEFAQQSYRHWFDGLVRVTSTVSSSVASMVSTTAHLPLIWSVAAAPRLRSKLSTTASTSSGK